ncbi:MAG: Rpn family recombination-promoting nuclease/putative transposase [Alkalispirochaeta sp.]
MEIHHAHDRFFRSFFSQPTHLPSLIRNALPAEVIATLDLNSLKLEPGTWIDRKNREHLSDLAASVDIVGQRSSEGQDPSGGSNTGSGSNDDFGRSAKVYILVEHKSYRDPAAVLQLLRYMVQMWSAEVRSGGRIPLTPIIPVLLYHGPAGGVVESFSDLFPREMPEVLKRYQVNFGAEIFDLPATSANTLRGNPASRAALWLMRTARRGAEEALTELQAVLHGAEDRLSDEEYQALARYLFETGELSAKELNGKIELLVHQWRIREGLLTTAEQLRKKGFEEGEEAGRYRERTELAREMLTAGEEMEKVARYTRLTMEELQALVEEES